MKLVDFNKEEETQIIVSCQLLMMWLCYGDVPFIFIAKHVDLVMWNKLSFGDSQPPLLRPLVSWVKVVQRRLQPFLCYLFLSFGHRGQGRWDDTFPWNSPTPPSLLGPTVCLTKHMWCMYKWLKNPLLKKLSSPKMLAPLDWYWISFNVLV